MYLISKTVNTTAIIAIIIQKMKVLKLSIFVFVITCFIKITKIRKQLGRIAALAGY